MLHFIIILFSYFYILISFLGVQFADNNKGLGWCFAVRGPNIAISAYKNVHNYRRKPYSFLQKMSKLSKFRHPAKDYICRFPRLLCLIILHLFLLFFYVLTYYSILSFTRLICKNIYFF